MCGVGVCTECLCVRVGDDVQCVWGLLCSVCGCEGE